MSLKSTLVDLPWNRLLALKEAIKMKWGTVPWPEDAPVYHTMMDVDEIEGTLRSYHFEGLYLSYNYEGQVLDLRRPEGVRLPNGSEWIDSNPRQLEAHIRARPCPEDDCRGYELAAHLEVSRYEHKGGHIKEVYFEWLTEEQIAALLEGESINEIGGAVDMEW